MPVPAKGIIAVGQFAVGVINISQFGIFIHSGTGQMVRKFAEIIGALGGQKPPLEKFRPVVR